MDAWKALPLKQRKGCLPMPASADNSLCCSVAVLANGEELEQHLQVIKPNLDTSKVEKRERPDEVLDEVAARAKERERYDPDYL